MSLLKRVFGDLEIVEEVGSEVQQILNDIFSMRVKPPRVFGLSKEEHKHLITATKDTLNCLSSNI